MKRNLFISLIAFGIAQCTQEEITSRSYSRVATKAVTDIVRSGATFNGEITYTSTPIKDYGFIWSADITPTISVADTLSLGATETAGPFSINVTKGMIAREKYVVRAYSRTNDYLVLGELVSFTSSGSTTPYVISRVDPYQHLMPGGTVTVFGNATGTFQVKINGQAVDAKNVSNITKSKFTLKLPDVLNASNTLSIVIAGQEIEAPQKLSTAFTKISTAKPIAGGYFNSVCAVGSKAYLGLGTDSLFVFDQKSNTLTFVKNTPILKRASIFSFSINGTGYFGGGKTSTPQFGLNDFYSVDTVTNAITSLPNLADASTIAMFALGGKGYRMTYKIVSGFQVAHEIFEFDPVTKGWTKKSNFPKETTDPVSTFEYEGQAYLARRTTFNLGDGSTGLIDLWNYNAGSDTWTKVGQPSLKADKNFGILRANKKVYLVRNLNVNDFNGKSWATDFIEFSPSTKKFVSPSFATKMPFVISGVFSGSSAGYVFNGSDIWRFDPLK